MSCRPAKRQRLNRNVFVDDSAVTCGDDTDEEDEEHKNDSSDDEGEREGEEEDNDSPQDTEDRHTRQARLRDAWDKDEGAGYWDGLLRRANARSQCLWRGNGEEEEGFQFREGDGLWEIGCWIGHEDLAVYDVLKAPALARSAIAHPSMPGRIFAEVKSIEQARRLANGIKYLNSKVLRPVPFDELYRIVHIESPAIEHHSWVRVRGAQKAWKHYRGDVGLIQTHGQKNTLLLVPRIPAVPGLPSEDRPAQTLAQQSTIVANFGPMAVQDGGDHTFLFQNRRYTNKGFLMVDYDGFDTIDRRDALPSMSEWSFFKVSGILEPHTLSRTESAILASRLKAHDRVKIVGGCMHGLLGVVKEVREDECVVHVPSQDLTESVARHHLRAEFQIGDEVKVLSAPYTGLIAWVIGGNNGRFNVMNLSKEIEAVVDTTDLEFHSSDFIFPTLRPRKAKDSMLGKQDPNHVFVGKRVMVVEDSQYKGYKGLIKSTTPCGMAQVELEARLQQRVKMKISQLALLSNTNESAFKIAKPTIILPSPIQPHKKISSSPLRNGPPLPIQSTVQRPSSPPFSRAVQFPPQRPSSPPVTPLPTTTWSSGLSSSWDPSSRTPTSLNALSSPLDHSTWTPIQTASLPPQTPTQSHKGPYWLKDPEFVRIRVQLKRHGDSDNTRVLTFCEVQEGRVIVQDGMYTRTLEFDVLEPILATASGQLVTPIAGVARGQVLAIRSIDGEDCKVYKKGTRVTKANPDLTCRIRDLVQVLPSLKRSLA